MLNLMKLGRLRRGMVILLLAFAFFDLAVIDIIAPQLCNDGFSSHSDSSPASTEEDCFCCCSHILPGYPVYQATLNTMPRIDIPSIDSLPSPPPQDTFHPPRLV